MALLEDIKSALRVEESESNLEIMDLIESAIEDLKLSGVNPHKVIETDPLIKRAITLYCKANYGYEDINLSNRFAEIYLSLKNHLVLSRDYSAYDTESGVI